MEAEGTGDAAADLFISNPGAQTARVVVSTPLFDPSFREEIRLRSGGSEIISFPPSLPLSGSEKSRKGISIVSDQDVSVVGMNKMPGTAGGFLALPDGALGTEYYAVTHYSDPDPPNSQNPRSVSQIAVVAPSDGTSVSFAFPPNPANPSQTLVQYSGATYKAGDVLKVALQKFETVQIQSDFDLTATRIYSNKPVAALSGNKVASVGTMPSGDHVVVQLPPVQAWGKTFILPSYPEKGDGYFVRIVACEPNTALSLAGVANSILIDKPTSVVEFALPESATRISSDKPIQVVQLTRSQSPGSPGDPSMILIPPVEQYGTEYVFQTPESTLGSYSNHLILICFADKISGFRLTGPPGDSPVSSRTWRSVQGSDPPMMTKSIALTPGTYRVFHEPADTRFAALLYGFRNEESYALPLGFSLESLSSKVCSSHLGRKVCCVSM